MLRIASLELSPSSPDLVLAFAEKAAVLGTEEATSATDYITECNVSGYEAIVVIGVPSLIAITIVIKSNIIVCN